MPHTEKSAALSLLCLELFGMAMSKARTSHRSSLSSCNLKIRSAVLMFAFDNFQSAEYESDWGLLGQPLQTGK